MLSILKGLCYIIRYPFYINLKINYNIKFSQLDWIYYLTSYMTNHVIIRFIIKQLLFFLDMSFNKYIYIVDYGFCKKKSFKPIEKLRKKLYMSIDKKSPKFNKNEEKN